MGTAVTRGGNRLFSNTRTRVVIGSADIILELRVGVGVSVGVGVASAGGGGGRGGRS
jgi:hypothetical protein